MCAAFPGGGGSGGARPETFCFRVEAALSPDSARPVADTRNRHQRGQPRRGLLAGGVACGGPEGSSYGARGGPARPCAAGLAPRPPSSRVTSNLGRAAPRRAAPRRAFPSTLLSAAPRAACSAFSPRSLGVSFAGDAGLSWNGSQHQATAASPLTCSAPRKSGSSRCSWYAHGVPDSGPECSAAPRASGRPA